MGAKLLAIAALAALPAVAFAQTSSSGTTPTTSAARPQQSQAQQSTSKGEVEAKNGVTPQMLEEQQDPNLIGSPAWWSTHATADGKPKRD